MQLLVCRGWLYIHGIFAFTINQALLKGIKKTNLRSSGLHAKERRFGIIFCSRQRVTYMDLSLVNGLSNDHEKNEQYQHKSHVFSTESSHLNPSSC